MKYNNYKFLLILLTAFFIVGCVPEAVKKDDIKRTAYETREEVIELQDQDPMDPGGLSLIEPKNAGVSRSVVEIQGNQKGVKFTDDSWQDYPIWLNLNVVPLRTFFGLLEELTGLNFIIGDEVTGDITLKLNNVNWVEVFEMVLREKNLIHDINPSGSVITVHTHDFVGKQSASYESALAAKIKVINSLSALDTKSTAIFKLNYTKPDVLSKQLSEVIATLEAGGDGEVADKRASFVIDTRTNSLIVQASPTDMEWIKTTIDSLDKPTKQVMVEVFIVEATDTFQTQLGSRISMYADRLGSADALKRSKLVGGLLNPPIAMGGVHAGTQAGGLTNNNIADPSGSIVGTFLGNSTELRIELQAMQNESLIKIVSNPKLFIIDNESGEIEDGQEVPYSLAAAAGATPTTAFKNASLMMKITPSIIPDGNIFLDIEVNNDSVAPTSTGTPTINKKAIKTKLLVADGGVAMIGGINKQTDTSTQAGVPFFQDIPILGNIFKTSDDKAMKNILYIFIAPKVLN